VGRRHANSLRNGLNAEVSIIRVTRDSSYSIPPRPLLNRREALLHSPRRRRAGRRRAGLTISKRRFLGKGLDAHLDLEQSGLPAGNFHFRAIAKLRVQAPIHAKFHIFDEIQIDNLATIGAEEAILIETLFESC
jgi:hypothetical protein